MTPDTAIISEKLWEARSRSVGRPRRMNLQERRHRGVPPKEYCIEKTNWRKKEGLYRKNELHFGNETVEADVERRPAGGADVERPVGAQAPLHPQERLLG